MRILHIDAGKELRGGQLQVLRLVEELTLRVISCTLLARADSPLYREASARGYQVERLSLINAARLARSHEIVHAHDARSHTFAALAGGAHLVVARRVAFPVRSRWKYARARHYIAVSQHVKSVLLAAGVPAHKISVVYDGVPILDLARPELVVAPATADPRKGASLAVEAARLAGVPLHFSSALEEDLLRASVFVYISQCEGLGSAALLAMSAGVPVIASKTGGLTEIVHHGETGLLVENTAQAIAQALRRLLDRPEDARRMGAAAREQVRTRFTIDRMVQRTIEVYRQVLV